jgi:tetratricopeptide (TPR) repeat protein
MKVGMANFLILHYGNLKPSEVKRTYYRKLGRNKIDENPLDPMAWFEMGGEEYRAGNYGRALRYFSKSYKLKPAPAAAYFIAVIHHAEKRYPEALEALEWIPPEGDIGVSKFALQGDILHLTDDLPAARDAYLSAVRLCQDICAGTDSEYSFRFSIESKLGFIEILLGQAQEGIARMEQAVVKLPSAFDLHDRLVKAWVLCGRDDNAAEAQERMLQYHADENHIARAAVLRIRSGNRERANQILRKGLELIPTSKKFRALLGAES